MKVVKKKPKIAVIGGGTGTFVVLSGLRDYEVELTAIMSMMDSGGSNKVLRDEFGLLPTSGIRQAIVALSEIQNDGQLLRKLFDYRYHQGVGISGMTFGNLFMAALADIYSSQIKSIETTCRLLRVKGNILPITLDDSHLVARFNDGMQVLGEHLIDESAKHDGTRRIVELQLIPPARLYLPARKAILDSDLVIFGPGDLYTNTIADLMVEGVIPAVKKTRAKIVFVMNLMTKYGDSFDYKASDFIFDLEKYLGRNVISYVIINDNLSFPANILEKYKEEHSVPVEDDLSEKGYFGIVRGDFLSTEVPVKQKGDKLSRSLLRHDPKKLAKAIINLT